MDTNSLKFDLVLDDEKAKWLAWTMSGSGVILFILMCYVVIYSLIALMIHLFEVTTPIEKTSKIKRA